MEKAAMNGIVLLDKPRDLTSMQCVERVRGILGAGKAGHAGTLDPAVTGVMLIALNEARKAMPVLIGLEKEYEGTMHLHGDAAESEIKKAAGGFEGRITQLPPVRSAVARRPRERDIYLFIISKTSGREIRFRVRCESGTYIRKLCHDFGEKLGTGAHMTKLRRTKIDGFSEEECVSLQELNRKDVIPLESVLERIGLKRVAVKKESLGRIRNGMPVRAEDIIEREKLAENEHVGIYHGSEIVALGIVRDARAPVIKTDRVFK